MTDDIAARLRAETDGATVNPDGIEAADENERLRAELAAEREMVAELKSWRKVVGDQLLAEIRHSTNLQAERDALREQYEEAIAANMRRAYELAAERLKREMQDRNNAELAVAKGGFDAAVKDTLKYRGENETLRAERDALRALLREAREWIVEGKVDFNDALADRINAALKGEDNA